MIIPVYKNRERITTVEINNPAEIYEVISSLEEKYNCEVDYLFGSFYLYPKRKRG